MAMPVATLNASENNINEVISFAQEFGAQLIYVGKPISLNENVTSSTLLAEEFANEARHAITAQEHARKHADTRPH